MNRSFIFAHTKPKILNSSPAFKRTLVSSQSFGNFPHIKECGRLEFHDIRLKSLDLHYNEGIEICYIHKGKYNWQIEDKEYLVYPGESFITFPWQKHGSPRGIMDIGQLSWIIIRPELFLESGELVLGNWSRLTGDEQTEVGNLFAGSKRQHFTNCSSYFTKT